MKWFGIGIAVVVVAIGLAGAQAHGQEERATRADDQGFVNDLTIAGLTEVQLGKIASERAASPDVKAFGQMMVKDHSKAGEELKQIASQLKIQQPAQLDQKHTDLVDKLSKLQGAEFDREYINAMVQGHQEVLGKVRARVDTTAPKTTPAPHPGAGDTIGHGQGAAQLTQFAAKAMPTVQMHLDRAKELQQKVAK